MKIINYRHSISDNSFNFSNIARLFKFIEMKKLLILIVAILSVSFNLNAQEQKSGNETLVEITTDFGNMTIMLYNETPKHRDNFIKLIKEGWYNGSVFHRIISQFMIQGGHNSDGKVTPGYTIPAEFNSKFIHKKGALSAARQGDQVNPRKASSGCQFYVVQGKKYSAAQLANFSTRTGVSYTDEQKQLYATFGGTPHLDMQYTVFGEVILGMEVIDKIAVVQTNDRNKPLKDIKMSIKIFD